MILQEKSCPLKLDTYHNPHRIDIQGSGVYNRVENIRKGKVSAVDD
jgi:hypothetical protein